MSPSVRVWRTGDPPIHTAPQAGGAEGRTVSRVLFPVSREPGDDHLSGTIVTDRLKQPTRGSTVRAAPRRLFGLAPTGGYRAPQLSLRAVGSYPTVSPLPVSRRTIGGLLSVALSVASRRPGVTWRSALWSSDFPRPPACARDRDHRVLPRRKLVVGRGAWGLGRRGEWYPIPTPGWSHVPSPTSSQAPNPTSHDQLLQSCPVTRQSVLSSD